MRKSISKQSKPERANFSVKRILVISIIFFMLSGLCGVMASNNRVKNVKIVLSSGYEMNKMTTNTKVEDILKENNIVVLEGESVTPDLNEELSDNNTIIIKKGEKKELAVASYLSEDEILESYKSILVKVITVQEEIPFETITKDVSDGATSTLDRVTQIGQNGIKEVTYRIKFKDGAEFGEREVVSEKVIKEKVDKIVEVRTRTVTSRGSEVRDSSELETIWAIVRQEGGSSYESALAVASSAVNRANSSRWSSNGSTMYEQLTAPNQYCYSIDNYWVKYLGGNVPDYVKEAVADAMAGKTNHPYTSFRSYYTSGSVNIGGNYYFGS